MTNIVTNRHSKRHEHMTYPYVLVVVDMQDNFNAARDPKTVLNVAKMVHMAKINKAYVILAHYVGAGETNEFLVSLLKGYRHKYKCYKSGRDKSKKISEILSNKKFDKVYVCGVNTGVCVLETVRGLSKKLPWTEINVVEDGCNCDCDYYKCTVNQNHEQMKELPNVKIG